MNFAPDPIKASDVITSINLLLSPLICNGVCPINQTYQSTTVEKTLVDELKSIPRGFYSARALLRGDITRKFGLQGRTCGV